MYVSFTLADQLRGSPLSSVQADVYSLATSSNVQPTSTNAFAPYFNDATVSDSPTGVVESTYGYDAVTGIGSPQANALISALAGLTSEAATASALTGTSGTTGMTTQASVQLVASAVMMVVPSDGASAGAAVAIPLSPPPAAPAAPAAPATDAVFASYAYPEDDDTMA